MRRCVIIDVLPKLIWSEFHTLVQYLLDVEQTISWKGKILSRYCVQFIKIGWWWLLTCCLLLLLRFSINIAWHDTYLATGFYSKPDAAHFCRLVIKRDWQGIFPCRYCFLKVLVYIKGTISSCQLIGMSAAHMRNVYGFQNY